MRIWRADEQLWWEVARACDHATFFHTPLWHRLAETAYPGCRDVTVAAECADGVRAVFPLIRRKQGRFGLLDRVVSTFGGCYGGPIADGALHASDRERLYRAVLKRQGRTASLVGNPYAADGGAHRRLRARHDTTHVLWLDAPFDVLFSRFSKGHRSGTFKGRRLGVTVRVARTIDDYRAYFAAYEASLRRWGDAATSRYPWKLFECGYRLAKAHPDRIILWLAERDTRVLAGAWVFYWNGVASYWHGAAHDEARKLSATNVLLADIIADACDRSCRAFDFNPSGGHEGVAAFKRRFSAEPVAFTRSEGADVVARGVESVIRVVRRISGTSRE